MLESMRTKKADSLRALEAIEPARFIGLLSEVRLEADALNFALEAIRRRDAEVDALDALAFVAKTTHQAHHEGEFPACQKSTCQTAIRAGVK